MPIDATKALSYGAIGLGCILAILAYRLLAKEQQQKEVRDKVIRAIYAFMVFSFLLTACGIVTEYLREINGAALATKDDDIVHLRNDLDAAKRENQSLNERVQSFDKARESGHAKLVQFSSTIKPTLEMKDDIIRKM